MNEPEALGLPLLSLQRIGKTFANGLAGVDEVDLTIREGDFLTLLGPSGCGKSTVLRMIAGLLSPTSGALDWPQGRPDTGFVFQEPTLLPWASVFDNVWLPLRLRGMSRKQATSDIEEALELVRLQGFEKTVPRELSGGMKMRVSIARALVTRPRLLLMDEPFAALDEINRFRLNGDLLDLWREQRLTVVFVTHSVFESVFLSSRIAVMTGRPGRIFHEFAVDAPFPRDEAFRTSSQYAALCRDVSRVLGEAMAASGGGAHDRR